MALFRGIQEYIALDANNITLVFDSGNIVNISGNIFLYPPQGHPILYNYYKKVFLIVFNKIHESMGLYNGKTTTTKPLFCSDPDSVDGETSGLGTARNHE